jgi:hypothetical protein
LSLSDHAEQELAGEIEAPKLDKHICAGPCCHTLRTTGKGVARYGDPILCQRCVSQLRSELSAIDTAAGILVAKADGYRESTGADSAIRAHRNASTRASASPVHDLIDELTRDLSKWMVIKRPVAARLGMVARPVTEVASWLSANASLYVDDRELAGPLTEVVHRWHLRLEKRAGTAPALRHKPLPCPRCRKRGLEWETGAQTIKCRECGRIMSVQEYDDLAADGAEATDSGAEETPARRGRKAAETT